MTDRELLIKATDTLREMRDGYEHLLQCLKNNIKVSFDSYPPCIRQASEVLGEFYALKEQSK